MIPDIAMPAVRRVADRSAPGREKSTGQLYLRLINGDRGGYLGYAMWRRYLKLAQGYTAAHSDRIVRYTAHEPRHVCASLLIASGASDMQVAHQMGHTNLEMIIRHYSRWSRKPERVGTLAHQISAKFPQILPENCQKIAAADAPSVRGGSRRSSQTIDSTRGNRGAGDRGRTGDVQLGKLAFYH